MRNGVLCSWKKTMTVCNSLFIKSRAFIARKDVQNINCDISMVSLRLVGLIADREEILRCAVYYF